MPERATSARNLVPLIIYRNEISLHSDLGLCRLSSDLLTFPHFGSHFTQTSSYPPPTGTNTFPLWIYVGG